MIPHISLGLGINYGSADEALLADLRRNVDDWPRVKAFEFVLRPLAIAAA